MLVVLAIMTIVTTYLGLVQKSIYQNSRFTTNGLLYHIRSTGLWLARNGVMDPCSSPYITHLRSLHFSFPFLHFKLPKGKSSGKLASLPKERVVDHRSKHRKKHRPHFSRKPCLGSLHFYLQIAGNEGMKHSNGNCYSIGLSGHGTDNFLHSLRTTTKLRAADARLRV